MSGPGRLDVVGSGLSMLCAVHCLAAPLLSAALPLLAGEGVELGAFLVLAGFTALVIGSGVRRHRRPGSLVLLALGLAALTALRALEGAELEGAEDGPLGPALVVLGSALLVAAHLANRRALRAHAGCC
ncbi:MerC domain-containing protein [Sorangium sp. So ce834]|uniref:MerC domain-containing protein n=1 Tax=Sorangium sp. So ce834 TaxID=3133321 RepID=UPI003F6226A9